MSNERRKAENNQLVADTYHSLAKARAPEHLNQKVLTMAAGHSRTPYSRARAWIRPLAWAATIGLSLAIVLEITRLPQFEPDFAGFTAPEMDRTAENSGRTEAMQQSPALEQADDSVTATESSQPATPAEESGPTEATKPSPALQQADDSVTVTESSRPATPAEGHSGRMSKGEIVPQNMAVPQKTEDQARAQAGPIRTPNAARTKTYNVSKRRLSTEQGALEPVTANGVATTQTVSEAVSEKSASAGSVVADEVGAAAAFAPGAAIEGPQSAQTCPIEVRESPNSWLACIAELRKSGWDDLAEYETAEFQKMYPDLEGLGVDK